MTETIKSMRERVLGLDVGNEQPVDCAKAFERDKARYHEQWSDPSFPIKPEEDGAYKAGWLDGWSEGYNRGLEVEPTERESLEAESDTHKLIRAQQEMLDRKDAECSALQKFKDYVHKRLDDAGIPTHPEGEHSERGCRIGDRLDIALASISDEQEVGEG